MALSSAEKMKAHRRRRRIGLEIYQVEVSEFLVVNRLIDVGRISLADSQDRDKVGSALSKLIMETVLKKM